MLLFVGTQSAQIIFVNHLCAINGRVLFGNFAGSTERFKKKKTKKKEKDECITVSLKCD